MTSLASGSARENGEFQALYRLLSWLSPSYPIGAFSYSHGLETAIEAGFVSSAETLSSWLTDLMKQGSGRNDAIFLRAAYDVCANDDAALAEIADLATAFQPTAELLLETTAQGRAFFDTTSAAWPTVPLERLGRIQQGRPMPLAVVFGTAAAGHSLPLSGSMHGYLHAFAANLIAAGIRLVPLGQTDGQRIVAALEPVIAETAAQVLALDNPLDHLASNTFVNDWCSMRHETQYTRLFRS